jgi:hypothetical protein
MKLMREWGGFNDRHFKLSDEPGIFCHLPENFMQDMLDVMTEVLKVSP